MEELNPGTSYYVYSVSKATGQKTLLGKDELVSKNNGKLQFRDLGEYKPSRFLVVTMVPAGDEITTESGVGSSVAGTGAQTRRAAGTGGRKRRVTRKSRKGKSRRRRHA